MPYEHWNICKIFHHITIQHPDVLLIRFIIKFLLINSNIKNFESNSAILSQQEICDMRDFDVVVISDCKKVTVDNMTIKHQSHKNIKVQHHVFQVDSRKLYRNCIDLTTTTNRYMVSDDITCFSMKSRARNPVLSYSISK